MDGFESVADALAATAPVASAAWSVTTTAVDGPAAVSLDASDAGAVDVVVWVGPATPAALAALVDRADRAGVPVVAYADESALAPEAAVDAGVADYVRAGEGGAAVLARRIGADDPPVADDGPSVMTDDRPVTAEDSQVTAEDPPVTTDGGPVGDAVGGDAGMPERAERVLDRIDEAVVGLDEDLQVTYANARVEEILGRPAAEFAGEYVTDVFPDTEGGVFETEYRAALDSQSARTFETHAPDDDAWLEVTVYPAADGLTVYVRDVTEHRHAEAELERNERALRDLQRLASNRDLSLDEKLDRALAVGCDRLDLPLGFVTRIDDGTQTIVAARGDDEVLKPGASAPLSEAYCRRAIEGEGLLALEHAAAEGWADDPAYNRFEFECYLGGKLLVEGDLYGTVCFAATERRERAFTAAERTFIELLVEWVSYELERRERERELERYETIVRSVEDGVYELDAEGRFTYVNPALAALTGREGSSLIGEHVSAVHGDDEVGADGWEWYTPDDLQASDLDADVIDLGCEAIETVSGAN